jgi:hypothetical protein
MHYVGVVEYQEPRPMIERLLVLDTGYCVRESAEVLPTEVGGILPKVEH